MAGTKLRIAWFSPLETSAADQSFFSKSAYASSIILPLLKDSCEVELFSARAGQRLSDYVSRHYLTAFSLHQERPFDIFFYNLENGKFCDFCRLHLALIPGITWVHDFTLIDDGPEPILNSPWTKMVELFNQEKDTNIQNWPSKKDQFLPIRPQALREVGMSFYTIFSAERDLEQFRQINPVRLNADDTGRYLPLPVDSKIFPHDTAKSTSKVLRVATCASPTVESHSHTLLAALAASSDVELKWLVSSNELKKCRELISEFDLTSVSVIEGRTPQAWTELLQESDLAVHFLYSFYQHSNPWLSISLAQGVFSTMLDFSESDYLPDDAVIKVSPGFSEVAQLVQIFAALKTRTISRSDSAAVFAKERFDSKVIADELLLIFNRLEPQIAQLQKQHRDFANHARKNLINQNIISDENAHLEQSVEVFKELGWL